MSIIIGADIVPTAKNSCFFEKENTEILVGKDLIQILGGTDYRVFNLETPLTDIISPIDKCGPALQANCSTIAGIKKLGVDLFTLANNHIMDQDENGLASTISLLEENGINYFGAGKNLSDAQKPFLVNVNEKIIGFYACAEHEFSIATDDSAGANPFDAFESFDHVAELRKKCDFLIVLYHGGKEHYQYPSPWLQRVCRKFVDKGANLVVCQHSHCIGCEEKYLDGTIVYGQGNFLFDSCIGPYVQNSLLIKINDDFSISYLPLVKVENGVRLSTGFDAENVLSAFKKRGEQIKEKGFVENEYRKFSQAEIGWYLVAASGFFHKPHLRLFYKVLKKLLGRRFVENILTRLYNKKDFLAIRNYIECEAHHELLLEGLKNK